MSLLPGQVFWQLPLGFGSAFPVPLPVAGLCIWRSRSPGLLVTQSRAEVRWGSFPGTLTFYVQICGFFFFFSQKTYFKVERMGRGCAALTRFPSPLPPHSLSGDGTS